MARETREILLGSAGREVDIRLSKCWGTSCFMAQPLDPESELIGKEIECEEDGIIESERIKLAAICLKDKFDTGPSFQDLIPKVSKISSDNLQDFSHEPELILPTKKKGRPFCAFADGRLIPIGSNRIRRINKMSHV